MRRVSQCMFDLAAQCWSGVSWCLVAAVLLVGQQRRRCYQLQAWQYAQLLCRCIACTLHVSTSSASLSCAFARGKRTADGCVLDLVPVLSTAVPGLRMQYHISPVITLLWCTLGLLCFLISDADPHYRLRQLLASLRSGRTEIWAVLLSVAKLLLLLVVAAPASPWGRQLDLSASANCLCCDCLRGCAWSSNTI
jgi:hypothetical protein